MVLSFITSQEATFIACFYFISAITHQFSFYRTKNHAFFRGRYQAIFSKKVAQNVIIESQENPMVVVHTKSGNEQ